LAVSHPEKVEVSPETPSREGFTTIPTTNESLLRTPSREGFSTIPTTKEGYKVEEPLGGLRSALGLTVLFLDRRVLTTIPTTG